MADSGPEGVDADVLVEVGSVVEGDSFQTLEVGSEVV
jgi:hypothetical protein